MRQQLKRDIATKFTLNCREGGLEDNRGRGPWPCRALALSGPVASEPLGLAAASLGSSEEACGRARAGGGSTAEEGGASLALLGTGFCLGVGLSAGPPERRRLEGGARAGAHLPRAGRAGPGPPGF